MINEGENIIVVCGSRTLKDYRLLRIKLIEFIIVNMLSNVVIMEGGQVSYDQKTRTKYGADYFAELFAKEQGYKHIKMEADWEKHGTKAGFVRNLDMVSRAAGHYLVAFWNGRSKGTAMTVRLAKRYYFKKVEVIKFEDDEKVERKSDG